MTSVPQLAPLYRDARQRVTEMVGELDVAELAAAVPACPGWSVADVVAHLTAVGQDALAGRLTKPPTDDETAAQVARFSGQPVDQVLGTWNGLGPQFEEVIAGFGIWPAVLDVVAHEHDIRGALGRPGARDSEAVALGAARLLAGLEPPGPILVECDGEELRVGPGAGEPLVLHTTAFEAFRWRLGRRSRAQLAAMEWSADPTAVLDHLVVFGPAARDVIE